MLLKPSIKGLPARLVLIALAAVLAAGYFTTLRFYSRPVLRIGMVDSQVSEYLKSSLGNWPPQEFASIRIEAVPLEYDDLFKAEMQDGPAFDVLMIDDPWLAQLVTSKKLARVPVDRFAGTLPRYSPEFLRLSWYRPETPRRPTLDEFTGKDGTHTDATRLAGLSESYVLYSLPYVGNFQALVRHGRSAARDHFDQLLSGDNVSWKGIETELGKGITGKAARFYSRLGSNNSALADFLPILWAEGGCLISRSGAGQVSGLKRYANTAPGAIPRWISTNALARSLGLAQGHIQYARFQDEDVQKFLETDDDSIGISWMAFRTHRTKVPEQMRWYPMPRPSEGADPASVCDPDDERSNGTGTPGVGVIGAWSLGVDARSSQKRIAWDFIEWALNEVLAARQVPQVGTCGQFGEIGPTASDRLAEYPTPFEDQLNCRARAAIRNSRTRPSLPQWREIEDAVGFRIRQAHWRTLSPEAAIQDADEDLSKLLLGD